MDPFHDTTRESKRLKAEQRKLMENRWDMES